MNLLVLKVDYSPPGELRFELQRPGGALLSASTGCSLEGLGHAARLEPRESLGVLHQLLPPNIARELGQWALDDPRPGLLAIVAEGEAHPIPWEYLPELLKMPSTFVIRQLVLEAAYVDTAAPSASRLLAAGWTGRPTFDLPGIEAELSALGQLGTNGGLQVQVLFEPSLVELARASESFRPDLLHLIPAAIVNDGGISQMVLSEDDQINVVAVDTVCSTLGRLRPRLVLLNSCSGATACRILAERLGTVVIGWLGDIQDRDAVEFARFMYARILDGESVIGALRAYRSIQPLSINFQVTRGLVPRERAGVPVVYTPWVELLNKPLRHVDAQAVAVPDVPKKEVQHAVETTALSSGSAHEEVLRPWSDSPSPTITVEFDPQKWLNPALLKNGRPAVNHLVLNSDRALRNVGIAVSCDTGNGISTVRQTLNLEKGPQPVPVDSWQFPVLYELIAAGVPRRQINFTVSCSLGGGLLAETTKPVLWMARSEWLDKPDTWRFIPAFVDPYCDAVLDVIGKADEVLKQIEAPDASFDAYQSNDGKHVTEQVKAVFNCLRDKPYELHYIAPPPIPVFAPGETFASGQRIRPLNEIVTRCRGTCHDLSVLFASCLEQIQIYPLIVLVTGHTFFGFWNDSEAHEEFWTKAAENRLRRPSDPAREWTITDPSEIEQLLNGDRISLVDAVAVTDRNAKFDAAVQAGRGWYELTVTDPRRQFDVAVDIQASRHAVQPL